PSAPPTTGLIAPPPGIAPIPGVAPAAPPAPPAPPASAPAPATAPSWAPSAPSAPSAPPAPAFVAPIEVDDDDDEVGATIVVDRKPRALWNLVLADGGVLPVTDEIVVLGRKPIEGSGAQSLSVPDTTRTLSKTHAKLELLQGRWIVTDLNSTNGVIVVRADGTEDLLDEGASAEVLDRFVLGKVELRLVKVGA
ncbi:MAG: FHA domain-containing protein, partial [Microbacteriaceae bacterium]